MTSYGFVIATMTFDYRFIIASMTKQGFIIAPNWLGLCLLSYTTPENNRSALTPDTMKLLVAAVGLMLSPTVVWAWLECGGIVECSTLSESPNRTFEVCASWTLQGPSPQMIGDETIYTGGYRNEYKIVTGLKEGADVYSLSESEAKNAFSSGIVVLVTRDDRDNDKCEVTVSINNKANVCSSCTFCGKDRFSADCRALPNGRNVTCESTGSFGDVGVFFPLNSTALSATGAKVRSPIAKAPTKAPVAPLKPKLPVTAPKAAAPKISAPKVRSPVKAPMKLAVPVKAPVKAKNAAPNAMKSPSARKATAPVRAPKK
jgi:hypothetical protein